MQTPNNIINCEFELIDGTRKCKNCGYITKVLTGRVFRECKTPVKTEQKPSLLQKLQNLNKTGEQWSAQGNPIVTEEEKQKRLEICKTCDKFHNDVCKLCGCNLRYKTKLESAHCPDNPPKW